jgi:hypothetical protein
MEFEKSTNGFPYTWKAGRVEQLIRDILERKAKQQLNVNRVMLINPTWMHEDNILENIKTTNPDFIICHNFVDPAVPKIFQAIEQSGRPYLILGNSHQLRIDFWAIVCDFYFKSYEEQDLQLLPDAKKFICLNRKPHPHRINLVRTLQSLGVFDQGYVSLGLPGDQAITIDDKFTEEQGISDEYGNLGTDERFVSNRIRNDIFSVGDLNIWNRSFLCIVTETEFSNPNPDDFFTSEKTFKPIIGMRPFMVYGQPRLRQHLKDSGFDIFEDIFDYSQINEQLGDVAKQIKYAEMVVDAVSKISDVSAEYQRIFYRLVLNKQRFRNYVYQQWNTLIDLDLTKYV